MRDWQLLLLGGAAATGKSTSGSAIARRLGVSCVSGDSLWTALKCVTSRESHPAFHHFEPTEEECLRGPEYLCARHIESAEALTPALEAFIDREMKEGHRLLLEGAWITPELAARRTSAWNGARAVFIYEPEQDQVLAAMMSRQSVAEPTKRQLWLAPMAWRYGNWLRDGARKNNLPIVEARPRRTLADRVMQAAKGENV